MLQSLLGIRIQGVGIGAVLMQFQHAVLAFQHLHQLAASHNAVAQAITPLFIIAAADRAGDAGKPVLHNAVCRGELHLPVVIHRQGIAGRVREEGAVIGAVDIDFQRLHG